MKRFRFQLEPVLGYKQQVLDSLMIELGNVQELVRKQENKRDLVQKNLNDQAEEYAQKSREGISVADAMGYQMGLDVLKQRLEKEEAILKRLREQAEAKRQEVVETRKDTHSLERLKEIRKSEYDQAAAKSEEKSLDDLTAARRAAAARESAVHS